MKFYLNVNLFIVFKRKICIFPNPKINNKTKIIELGHQSIMKKKNSKKRLLILLQNVHLNTTSSPFPYSLLFSFVSFYTKLKSYTNAFSNSPFRYHVGADQFH